MLNRYADPETLALLSTSPVEVCRMVFAAGKTPEGIAVLRGPARQRPLCRQRLAIIWAATTYTRASFRPIGRALNKDHSWTVRGFQQAEKLRKYDGDFRRMCEELRR